MPTTQNKEYQQIKPIPDEIAPSTEVFYHPSTNEVFEEYDEYFERMIQLNSASWTCAITGRSGMTYEEALASEKDAIDQINSFPGFLETPILFLIHHFTCRARVDELVQDVMAFMRDRYFMDEEVVYRHTSHRRLPARIISVDYRAETNDEGIRAPQQPVENGTSSSKTKSPNKSPSKRDQPPGMELCAPECLSYGLQILKSESQSESSSSEEEEDGAEEEGDGGKIPSQVFKIGHTQIGRGRNNYATRSRIKLFIKYYTEMGTDGRMRVKPSSVEDFRLDRHRWEQFSNCPEPKFPQTRSNKKIKMDRLLSNDSRLSRDDSMQQPSTSSTGDPRSSGSYGVGGNGKAAANKKAEIRRRRIIEQQMQLEPLFKQADRYGVENMERWRQGFQFLSEEDINGLRMAIAVAKEAERKRQVEERRRQREALNEWRKPRDDLQCDDLQPFPNYKELIWPDWVPRQHYWDILSIQSFFDNFAQVLFQDRRNPFNLTNIATAIVSRQVSDKDQFYEVLDWLMTAINECLVEEEGQPADLTRPEHIGNESNKDFDHPVYGPSIRQINKDCELLKKIHGVHVHVFSRSLADMTEIIRLHLLTSGYYTMFRRQLRGNMHCYEDDGYRMARSEPEIMEILEKSSVFALSPKQRVTLINVLINQLLSHARCRTLIDKRTEALNELRRHYRHLKAVDQQHEKEARDAQQYLVQQSKGSSVENDQTNGEKAAAKIHIKELANLRRALVQLNEGRRVQNITELKDRMVDEHNPLPWTQMENANEIQEFRAVQRNFHGDKMQEILRKIYELQGRMGMYYLGRDRAFRAYYYLCSTFIIHCPPSEELGQCGQRTPKNHHPNNEEAQEEDEDDDDIQVIEDDDGDQTKREESEKNEEKEPKGEAAANGESTTPSAVVDPLMACSGSMQNCPVHNPPEEAPKLLYYMEKDAVKKLLAALNPRGFREAELAENIALFGAIYKREMIETTNRLEELRKNPLPASALLFGFIPSLPKELVKEESPRIADHLHDHVRAELLEIEAKIHERRLGTPRCSVGRDQWLALLEGTGDTTQVCVKNCVPISNSDEYLYTAEELGAPDQLTSVQKLGIALIQIVHGVRPECMHSPFMNETKKNAVVKRTPSQTFVEWQRALKGCQSPSAVALFATTFEFAVNWDYNQPEEEKQQNGSSKIGRRQPKAAPPAAPRENDKNGQSGPSTSKSTHLNKFREADLLIANAAGLLVTGIRNRKPVTKYGECEMDLDKLNFEDEEEEKESSRWDSDEEDGQNGERGGYGDEEDEERTMDDNSSVEGDRPTRRRLRSHHDLQQQFAGYDRYEGLSRKRKLVTHFDPTSYHTERTMTPNKQSRRPMDDDGDEEEDDEKEEDDEDGEHGSSSSTGGKQNGSGGEGTAGGFLEEWQQYG